MASVAMRIEMPEADWAPWSAADRRALRDAAANYLGTLAAALCLPATLDVTIGAGADLLPGTLRLSVGGESWRVSSRTGGAAPIEVGGRGTAATQLCRALFRAREVLLTPAVAAEACSAWRLRAPVPEALRLPLLARCLRQGRALDAMGETLRRRRNPVTSMEALRQAWHEALIGTGPARVGLRVAPGRAAPHFDANLAAMGNGLFRELGIRIAFDGVSIGQSLDNGWVQPTLNDMPLPPLRELAVGEKLVMACPTTFGSRARPADNPVQERGGHAIVSGGSSLDAETAKRGLTSWTPDEALVLMLAATARTEAGAFMTPDLLRHTLDHVRLLLPQLVAAVQARVTDSELAALLEALLDAGISVRDMRTLLQALATAVSAPAMDIQRLIVFIGSCTPVMRELSPAHEAQIDMLRATLKRYLSHKMSRGGARLRCILFDAALEKAVVAGHAKRNEVMSGLRDAMAAEPVRNAMAEPDAERPIFLTTQAARPRLATWLKWEYPDLAVLAYQELSPDMDMRPLVRVHLGPEEP
jgi:type III secretion protein V